MNDLQRWDKAAIKICHEAKELGQHTIDIDLINERIHDWKIEQEKAANISITFHNWMNSSERNFSPNSTIADAFETFWYQELKKP